MSGQWEYPMQDDSSLVVVRKREGDYRLRCDCGWRGKAKGDAHSNEVAMEHVLEHDTRYEEGLAAEEAQQ